jgi:hypothetical protein
MNISQNTKNDPYRGEPSSTILIRKDGEKLKIPKPPVNVTGIPEKRFTQLLQD